MFVFVFVRLFTDGEIWYEYFKSSTTCFGTADSAYAYSNECRKQGKPQPGQTWLSNRYSCGSGLALSTSTWYTEAKYSDDKCQSLAQGSAWKNQNCIGYNTNSSTMYDYPNNYMYATSDCTGAPTYTQDLESMVDLQCQARSWSGFNSIQYALIEN
jgi:hypothetical protein